MCRMLKNFRICWGGSFYALHMVERPKFPKISNQFDEKLIFCDNLIEQQTKNKKIISLMN